MREYFLIDAGAALHATRDITPESFWFIMTIMSRFYCDGLAIEDDPAALSGIFGHRVDAWPKARSELLDAGIISITNNQIVPAASWARPEMDA